MQLKNVIQWILIWFLSCGAIVNASLAHHHRVRGHRGLAKRTSSGGSTNSRWTFYDVGLGACGKTNQPSDFIVALNIHDFQAAGMQYPGPQCFKMIEMTYKGKTARAQIMDMCPGCPPGGLDLSKGLFDHFADEALGVLQGSWSYVDGGGNSNTGGGSADNTTPAEPPKTSPTAEHTTISTPAKPPKTSTTSEAHSRPTLEPPKVAVAPPKTHCRRRHKRRLVNPDTSA